MRAVGGDGGFGRHARVADAVRALHVGKIELPRHLGGGADLLVELHAVADADHHELGRERREGGARGGLLGGAAPPAPRGCRAGWMPMVPARRPRSAAASAAKS